LADAQIQTIFQELKNDIVTLKARPNQRLTETEISRKFNCSRTPVREALRKLEQEGWIKTIPHQGYYVRSYTALEIDNIFEVRIALERLSVRLAGEQSDHTLIQQLRQDWVSKASNIESPNVVEFDLLKDDTNFHETIARASGNEQLHQYLTKINEQIHMVRQIDINLEDRKSNMIANHIAILDLILNRQLDEAQLAIDVHIRTCKDKLKSFFVLYL
jgi:DNA-binding GntR family transcriptional regulator